MARARCAHLAMSGPSSSVGTLNIVVGIATSERRTILGKNVALLALQTRLPDRLVVCPAASKDVDEEALMAFPKPSSTVRAQIGASAQRNKILASCANADIIVFFDDDFFADSRYIETLEQIFVTHPDVAGVTGQLIADGAQGPGISVEEGLDLIQSEAKLLRTAGELVDVYGTYGCNMAFRVKPLIDHAILFDENLPLYSWQEDIDFSVRVRPVGRIVKSAALTGVHLGTKRGRTSGVRLGYSQIANPFYLIRKGSMSWRHASKLIWRNIAANLVRSFYPEPWVDRKGRLKGNFLATCDIVRGRSSPARILQL